MVFHLSLDLGIHRDDHTCGPQIQQVNTLEQVGLARLHLQVGVGIIACLEEVGLCSMNLGINVRHVWAVVVCSWLLWQCPASTPTGAFHSYHARSDRHSRLCCLPHKCTSEAAVLRLAERLSIAYCLFSLPVFV